jgi:hypothetical protein
MNTAKKSLSSNFILTEFNKKYGISTKNKKTILYPLYDFIMELDNCDFIFEQEGKVGYAYFTNNKEFKLILPNYDGIIKLEQGLKLIIRGENEDKHYWYDLKNHNLYPDTKYIKSFKHFDLLISTKKTSKPQLPFLKRRGTDQVIKIKELDSFDVLYELPSKACSLFACLTGEKEGEYKFFLLYVFSDGTYRITDTKNDISELLRSI